MSKFSQMLGNRAESQRIFEQRRRIKQLERKLKKSENVIHSLEDYLNKIKDTSTLEERMMAKFLLKYIKDLKESDKQ